MPRSIHPKKSKPRRLQRASARGARVGATIESRSPAEVLIQAGAYRPTPPAEDLKDHDRWWAETILPCKDL